MPSFKIILLLALAFLLPTLELHAASTKVYFSPNGGCTTAIVREIAASRQEIWVQAYSFTSASIARSLVEAYQRGVKVTAVLDKTNDKGAKYSGAKYLSNAGIPVYIDYKPAIAHSKVIVIDQSTVITGSFNFTKSAETKNVENLIIFKGHPKLAQKYLTNISKRIRESRPYIPRYSCRDEALPLTLEQLSHGHSQALGNGFNLVISEKTIFVLDTSQSCAIQIDPSCCQSGDQILLGDRGLGFLA